MDELEDALNRVLAIVGSDRKWWDRIDRFVAEHRPKLPRKRRGIKDWYIKLQALEAYDDAPRGKKPAAEAAIYAKYGLKVGPELAAKNRLRVRKHLIEELEELEAEMRDKHET